MHRLYFLFAALFFFFTVEAQQPVHIPAAGNSWLITNRHDNRVITKAGITGWTDTAMRIRTYFRTERSGNLRISLIAKVPSGKSRITVLCGRKAKTAEFQNVTFDTIPAGEFIIDDPGYNFFELKGISTQSGSFAEIPGFILSGQAIEGRMNYVKDDFYFGRRGPSVHLRYEIPAASPAEYFYNEVTVPFGNDTEGSYFMANGFADGYFGIQVNSAKERRILFSVWSPYKTDNPGEIPDEYKILLLRKGKDVITKEFGNEGSGGQSYRKFDWCAGTTYRFLLKGTPAENSSTDYTAWFFAPENGNWELIASFRRPKTDSYLKNLYSFLENFIPETGFITRKGCYSNQWIRDTGGNWYELTAARSTADATAGKGARLDYAGGTDKDGFFLMNCGFFSDSVSTGRRFVRSSTGRKPSIELVE